MKVLVADKLEDSALQGLKNLGCEVDFQPDLNDEALTNAIAGNNHRVLIVRSTKVTKEHIEAGKIELIIRAGAGVNTIDVASASEKGVFVANCPGKNSIAVAELAFGLMLAIDRRIPDNVIELREGRWNKKEFSKGTGLYGTTLGLIGLGNIAQEMIPRARAFGMNVIALSRWMTPESAAALGIARADSLEDLARQSDIVSIHIALNPETKGIINEEFINNLKPGSTIINTSRAEVIDQPALIQAVEKGHIRAGLDVFEDEPGDAVSTYDGKMKDIPGIYCTHHIGASTVQAQEAVAMEVVRIVAEFRATGTPPNLVNVQKRNAATHLLIVRHQDRVGVLSHVLGALRDEGVNVQEMENIILGQAQSAIAQISLDKEPSPNCITAIKTHPLVFDTNLMPLEK